MKFLIEDNIELLGFINNEDINYIKSLLYGIELMAKKVKEK